MARCCSLSPRLTGEDTETSYCENTMELICAERISLVTRTHALDKYANVHIHALRVHFQIMTRDIFLRAMAILRRERFLLINFSPFLSSFLNNPPILNQLQLPEYPLPTYRYLKGGRLIAGSFAQCVAVLWMKSYGTTRNSSWSHHSISSRM
jgi:hypothetical protein